MTKQNDHIVTVTYTGGNDRENTEMRHDVLVTPADVARDGDALRIRTGNLSIRLPLALLLVARSAR